MAGDSREEVGGIGDWAQKFANRAFQCAMQVVAAAAGLPRTVVAGNASDRTAVS